MEKHIDRPIGQLNAAGGYFVQECVFQPCEPAQILGPVVRAVRVDVIDDVFIAGWRTVEGGADYAMDRHTGQQAVTGREALASKGPCLVERTGAFPELV